MAKWIWIVTVKNNLDNLAEDFGGQAQMSVSDSRKIVVELDQDHPGFRDAAYRDRRNTIAQIAFEHQPGTPVPDAPYTEEENHLWGVILEMLQPIHEQWACREFLAYWERINFPSDRIPQMEEVTALLKALDGFSFEPVCGLVLPKTFLVELKRDVMLATQYIRHYSKPAYTPEPDVVHEIVGHGAMLVEPRFVALNRLFGEVAEQADEVVTEKLIRLYWWSIEFGLIKENGNSKAIGAGLLSSIGELGSIDERPHRPFEPEVMEVTDFDPTAMQPFYFCADSSDAAIDVMTQHLESLME
ncbi:MAG: phenylalanine 4-monooxygenase [Myxococcales bacterium]|nr:phenylalanine 4-monooxygenase [Myxococcales bacterium]|tara:strand:- start:298 stop:1197 length:900 start_codon:yes stop_codon:yes gene_type:complete